MNRVPLSVGVTVRWWVVVAALAMAAGTVAGWMAAGAQDRSLEERARRTVESIRGRALQLVH